MFFVRKKKKDDKEPCLVASIMPAFSGVYSELLKEHNIPFFRREQLTGGCLRIITGGLLIPDDFYVSRENYEKALEIYRAYIEPELEED